MSTATHSVCAFWIGADCYGLDTSAVAEVVALTEVVAVPRTPNQVLGVFALRGAAGALVDLDATLELGATRGRPVYRHAVVLRTGAGILAAIGIDRVEAVVAGGDDDFHRGNADDDARVRGFLTPAGRNLVITMLDTPHVIERLEQLKFR